MEWIEVFKALVSAAVGAVASGVPLWYQIRKLNNRLKTEDNKITQREKINAEAEWKRIIEFRDAELVRLRERDDQQEKQIDDLWEKHVQCQRSEAAQAERIKANEERIKSLEDKLSLFMTSALAPKILPQGT